MKPATIISRLCAHPMLAGWKITHIVEHNPPDPAKIDYDFDMRVARITLHKEWQTLCIGTLEELISHELGHLLAGDVFRFIDPSTASQEAEERLATRFGLMLIEAAKLIDRATG